MEKVSRIRSKSSPIERLAHKHAELKTQVAQLAGQRFLTAAEDRQVHALKRARLAAKDALRGLLRADKH